MELRRIAQFQDLVAQTSLQGSRFSRGTSAAVNHRGAGMSVAGLAADLEVVGWDRVQTGVSDRPTGSVKTPLLGGSHVDPAPAPRSSLGAAAKEVMASSLVLTPHGSLGVGADAANAKRPEQF